MCLIVLLAFIGPRIALGYTWIFTTRVDRAFESWAWPVVGFVFLPWTTLAYVVAHDGTGVGPVGWLVVALGLLADMSSWGASSRARDRA